MQVDFHLVSGDVLGYVCRLARKAARQTPHLCIVGNEQALRSVSRMLWQLAPTDFLAHATDWDARQVQALSGIRLSQDPRAVPVQDILIHMGSHGSIDPSGYRRMFEIVDAGQPDRVQQARELWRQYQAQGYHLKYHDSISPPIP